MSKILLWGASGYIGEEFRRQIPESELLTISALKVNTYREIRDAVLESKAEFVINSAAFVTKPSVDLCEDHKMETLRGNLIFPTHLAAACESTGVPLLHISTGCLYNGDNKGNGWTEEDPPQLSFEVPCGTYVGSKELAERVVRQYHRHYIMRTRLPFDHLEHPRNYLTKLRGFTKIVDESNSLSHRGDFVRACLEIHRLRPPYGTYNATNPGAVSAMWVCEQINKYLCAGRRFKYWDKKEFASSVARTPKSNCMLSVAKLGSIGITMPGVEDAVIDSLINWKYV